MFSRVLLCAIDSVFALSCYSSVHAEFTIDLYSSYETHKSKCLILCRDLRRSITVKFLKICIGSYETKNLLTN